LETCGAADGDSVRVAAETAVAEMLDTTVLKKR
jgi:hypothetical protein